MQTLAQVDKHSSTLNSPASHEVWYHLRWVVQALLAYFAVGVALVAFMFPVFWMVTSAIKSDVDVASMPPLWIFEPTLHNFVALFIELGAGRALLNSLVVVGLSTCLAMICGSMAAYALARFEIAGKNVMALEILSVRMLPPIVSAVPFFILARQLDLFDTRLLLTLIYTLSGLPFVVWMMRVFTEELPKSVEEAAMIDGCGRLQVLFKVTLPMLLPGLAATTVIVFMFAWNEYLFASLLTSENAKTLPVIAANAIKPKVVSWGLASAAGVLMSLPVVVLVLFMQRYLVRGLTFGALKG